ncbi:HTH-type transcriptional regulator SyrM 1 [compost metagenome]
MLWVVPSVLGKTMARFFPLLMKPVPLALPEFDVALYWHDRFHRDPQNKWFREMVAAALRQSLAESS